MMKKKFRYLLILSIIFPLMMSGLDAQDIKLKKWVVGSGGAVNVQTDDGLTMSGVSGQLAIEKLEHADNTEWVYQGFWTPLGMRGTDVEPGPEVPEGADLTNYPNPFSGSTDIKFTLPSSAYVTLTVYDVAGNKVKELFHGMKGSGEHTISWDAKDAAGVTVGSGSYLYELKVESAQNTGAGFGTYKLKNIMVVVK